MQAIIILLRYGNRLIDHALGSQFKRYNNGRLLSQIGCLGKNLQIPFGKYNRHSAGNTTRLEYPKSLAWEFNEHQERKFSDKASSPGCTKQGISFHRGMQHLPQDISPSRSGILARKMRSVPGLGRKEQKKFFMKTNNFNTCEQFMFSNFQAEKGKLFTTWARQ